MEGRFNCIVLLELVNDHGNGERNGETKKIKMYAKSLSDIERRLIMVHELNLDDMWKVSHVLFF